MDKWLGGVVAALLVSGICALVIVYGNVGKLQTDVASLRREHDRLDAQLRTLELDHERLKERVYWSQQMLERGLIERESRGRE